jgi:toxin HigB-1
MRCGLITIDFSRVEKPLKKLPIHIQKQFGQWVKMIKLIGIEATRKVPGYHDEPLQGKRFGQRSIRLNRSYRAIYRIQSGEVTLIEILEVNKHDY